MITKETKISKLLEQHPHSLNVLLSTSPHFSKLQNKFLRKALAGRVTVEQAALIAGVDLNNLLNELNNNGNADVSPGSKTSSSVENILAEETFFRADETLEEKFIDEEKIASLDVRPILNSGKDPLKEILSKIKELKTGETLLIINSFEPIPLYSLLGKKGFSHLTKKENDIFKIYFYKNKGEVKENPHEKLNVKSVGKDSVHMDTFGENIFELDVSDLQPPEPMMKILENLNKIDDNSCMLVHHHREPHLLYPKLEERGYQAVCHKLGENSFKIIISKKSL